MCISSHGNRGSRPRKHFQRVLAFRASFFELAKLRARRAMLSPPDSLVLLQKLCNSVLAKRMGSMELFHAV